MRQAIYIVNIYTKRLKKIARIKNFFLAFMTDQYYNVNQVGLNTFDVLFGPVLMLLQE